MNFIYIQAGALTAVDSDEIDSVRALQFASVSFQQAHSYQFSHINFIAAIDSPKKMSSRFIFRTHSFCR